MSFKDVALKKYVVKLSAEEREYLDQLIRKRPGATANEGADIDIIEGRCRRR